MNQTFVLFLPHCTLFKRVHRVTMDKLNVKNTDVVVSVHHDHHCSVWKCFTTLHPDRVLWCCIRRFSCCMRSKNTACVVTMIWVSYWLMSRNSHVCGSEPMRAETFIQEQQSSLHNSRIKGIQTGLKKKKMEKRTRKSFFFKQPSVNMSIGRTWQKEMKDLAKERK